MGRRRRGALDDGCRSQVVWLLQEGGLDPFECFGACIEIARKACRILLRKGLGYFKTRKAARALDAVLFGPGRRALAGLGGRIEELDQRRRAILIGNADFASALEVSHEALAPNRLDHRLPEAVNIHEPPERG